MDDLESLRTRNASLLKRLHETQSKSKTELSRLKQLAEDKENISRKRHYDVVNTADPNTEVICKKQAIGSCTTPQDTIISATQSSCSARKKLQSKSILLNSEPSITPKSIMSQQSSLERKLQTSTPRMSANKRKLGPRTPVSVKKRRAIIERNISVESRNKTLCATPINYSKTLNFSYATPRSSEKIQSHSYNTRSSTSMSQLSSIHPAAVQTLLEDEGNNRRLATLKADPTNRSCLLSPTKKAKKAPGRVTFQQSLSLTYSEMLDEQQQHGEATHRQGERPLLGYDWIAGILDNDQSLDDKPDTYFEEMNAFRNRHKRECVKSSLPAPTRSPDIGPEDQPNPEIVPDPDHTCIHTYHVNERLFTVPINRAKDGASYCPICKTKRKKPTSESPGYVRISIPSSALAPSHKRKPHRRKSFEPSDSCALSEHCLAGYDSSRPSTIPPAKNLDLKHTAKGVKAKMQTNEYEVNKILRETKKSYKEPDYLRKTKAATFSLRKHCPDLADNHSSRRFKTDRLLNTSHAIRQQLQTLEQKYHKDEAAPNSTRYPLL